MVCMKTHGGTFNACLSQSLTAAIYVQGLLTVSTNIGHGEDVKCASPSSR